ncbi:hypothetical protein KKH05_01180 [Patescibacteria group bacterium]|nr:hypothetical protein [Patescibacteria group bacterium]
MRKYVVGVMIIFLIAIIVYLVFPKNADGQLCGGLAGNLPENQCPFGYTCQYDGDYSDAGGVCVDIFSFILSR